jgi:hypothetical protein
MTRHLLFLLPLALTLRLSFGSEKQVNFEEHIKPIFREHCLKCHGEDVQKADLNLQTHATALKGGSGVQIKVKCGMMLEGYRPGRVVRFYPATWPVNALPQEERFEGRA